MIDPPESMILLGAGASAEAGVPTSFALTDRLVAGIEARDGTRLGPALNFVCGALIAYDSARGLSPFKSLDVERVFSAVELLAERRTLEVTPFVSSWHPAVDAWDKPLQGLTGATDARLRKSILGDRGPSPSNLINVLIEERISGDADSTVYGDLARRMVSELRSLLRTKPKDVLYLEPLAQAASQPGGLTVATLNYDLSVEHAAKGAGVPLSTGIEAMEDGMLVDWPREGVRLMKLHGSVDWAWYDAQVQDGYLPFDYVGAVDPSDEKSARPAMIFGQRGKLRAEGPFLNLLSEFEDQLSRCKQLISIGYSFRDDHVNEILRRWISEDIVRKITVVDPFWPDGTDWAGDFRELMNLHLIPGSWMADPSFEQRLTVRRQPCSEFLSGD